MYERRFSFDTVKRQLLTLGQSRESYAFVRLKLF